MNFQSKQSVVKKEIILKAVISTNKQLISLVEFRGNIMVYSTKNLKQLFKITTQSEVHVFSPSSSCIAIEVKTRNLEIIMVGNKKLIHQQQFDDCQLSISFMKFQNENTLVIGCFNTSQIFKIDIVSKVTKQFTIMKASFSAFDYDERKDICIFMERETNNIYVWNAQDDSIIFTSQPLKHVPYDIKLFDKNNLVLFKGFQSQVIYEIDYQKQVLCPIEFQIPISDYEFGDFKIYGNLIVSTAPFNYKRPEVRTVMFNKMDCLDTITRDIVIPFKQSNINTLGDEKQIFILIIADNYYKAYNYHHYLIRCGKI